MMKNFGKKAYTNLLLIFCVIALVLYVVSKMSVNPQKIVEKSVLSGRTFETKVEEVISPKYKIKAYLYQDTANPIIGISFIFKKAGLAYDEDDKIGVSALASSLLNSGAANMNAEKFNEELENKAIGINFSSNMDDFSGSLITLKENADRAYEMLNMALTRPRFDNDEIKRIKAQTLAAIKIQQERPNSILSLEFAKELYGDHPYSRNPLGDEKAIEKIDQSDLRKYVNDHLVRDNLIVGAAGDISAEELGRALDDIFGDLPQSGSDKKVENANIDFSFKERFIDRTSAQDLSAFAAKGVARTDPDFYPLYVANYIFGGSGLSSRLALAAREEKGLTYSIYSYLSLSDKSNMIVGGFSSTSENFEEVKNILENEWARIAQNGVTKAELNEAKNYLISSYNLRFSSIGTIADIMAYIQRDDLGIDFLNKRNSYVENVSLDQVNEVSKKYFNKDKLIFVSIGNFKDKTGE